MVETSQSEPSAELGMGRTTGSHLGTFLIPLKTTQIS